MNSSIYHSVPVMIQPQSWACWYTSMQMVVRYYRSRNMGSRLRDPSEDPEVHRLYTENIGIGGGANPAVERERIASKLGFASLYMSLTKEGMWQMLEKGPAIYAGRWPGLSSGHWVVIVGISDNTLAINDPGSGLVSWNYDRFMGEYLLQTASRPLIYVP
jgi:ABC-type bacteriocin/lantibiotic exporter with double-glycine peptidase domain